MSDDEEMPFGAFNATYSFVKQVDEKNFNAKCKKCGEVKKCAFSSSSNLRSHLKVCTDLTTHQILA